MDSRAFLDFLKVAERLKCNTRHSYTSSGRHESVAEHSWRLTMMACVCFMIWEKRSQETFRRLKKQMQIPIMKAM